MEKLQLLTKKWKKEADNLADENERQYDQDFFFSNLGAIRTLLKCIREVEETLNKNPVINQ